MGVMMPEPRALMPVTGVMMPEPGALTPVLVSLTLNRAR